MSQQFRADLDEEIGVTLALALQNIVDEDTIHLNEIDFEALDQLARPGNAPNDFCATFSLRDHTIEVYADRTIVISE